MSEPLIQTPSVFGDNGNFLLERELGSGGMGGVYMGRDKMLDRPVAVKVMLRELGSDAEFVEKFKKEAQAAARLIHPNIIQVYSYGICNGMPYIAMELAAGGSLFSLMGAANGKTDIQRALKICQQTAQALQCATDQGVIHGDVKPENILLDANGNAKLVDFGLAAMQKDTTEIWGTPYYISPEKVKKEPVDFRSDMYSLGATLYHALTGVAPFEGEDSVAVVKKRFEGAPKRPSEIRPEISPAVDALVLKMLAVDREDRYPSFEALLQAFKDVLTTGLTQKSERPDNVARPTRTTASMRPGVHRTTAHGRRITLKRPGDTVVRPPVDADEREGGAERDDEEGGNLAAKVVLFVVGGLLAVGAVVGGLFWFIHADKKARQEESQAQVLGKISEARASIAKTREMAQNFDKEFIEFSERSVDQCRKYTDKLKKLLPDFAGEMKPPQTAELLKAIALTNAPAQAAAPAPAADAKGKGGDGKAAASAPAEQPQKRMTLQEEAARLGLEPPPEDLDPASPEGAEFLAKLKEAREKAAKERARPKAAAPDEKDASAGEKKDAPPMALKEIQELWERAYSCQASQIKIALAARKILAECDKANEIKEETEASAKALGELSFTVRELYERMTSSQDVINVRKAITLIKSKGEKVVKQTIRELTIKKAEEDRAAAAARQKALEEARLEKLAAEKAALIEKETTEIAAKFDAIAAQGCFRQLDWKSALRQLDNASQFFRSAEGQLAKELQVKKVNDMKKVQDLFIAKLKGYTFRGKLRNHVVASVDEKEIAVRRTDGKSKKPLKIAWQKFYRDYPGNFNEIINHFIINGRKHAGLNLRDWADAMTGAALTMRLVCAEVDGAMTKATQLAKEVVRQFPEYEKTMKQIFPDMELGASEEE